MYSLWRGAELMGEITPELPGDGGSDGAQESIVGLLQLRPGVTLPETIVQTTFAELPERPVLQQAFPAPGVITAGPGKERVGARSAAAVRAQAVPDGARLRVRDATGQEVPTRGIMIQHRLMGDSRDLPALCAAAGVPMSEWLVFANRLESIAGAP